MYEKLLTIAIPTYNRVDKLQNCIARVLAQVTDEVEVLVSDNCSSDGTDAYLEKVKSENHSLTYCRNERNLGPDRNFLNCYERATGKYVWLLGDDDYLLPGAVKSVLGLLSNNPVFMHLNTCSLNNEDTLAISRPRLNESDRIFHNKEDVLSEVGIFITFISSLILKRKLIIDIQDKNQYIGTYFLQSHIAMKVMEMEGCYIINGWNCLVASPNRTVNYDLYYVWFKCLYNLFFQTGIECGFSRNVLSGVFYQSLKYTVVNYVFRLRKTCSDISATWNKECIWDCLKAYPDLKVLFFVIVNCPLFMLRFWQLCYKVLLRIEHKCKRKNGAKD